LVIAGNSAAVDRVLARLAELGVRKAVKLAVSVPSHCALMRGAADQLAKQFEAITWSQPRIPVIQNVEATAYDNLDQIRSGLARQLYSPVRWTDSVRALAAGGATRVAEC